MAVPIGVASSQLRSTVPRPDGPPLADRIADLLAPCLPQERSPEDNRTALVTLRGRELGQRPVAMKEHRITEKLLELSPV